MTSQRSNVSKRAGAGRKVKGRNVQITCEDINRACLREARNVNHIHHGHKQQCWQCHLLTEPLKELDKSAPPLPPRLARAASSSSPRKSSTERSPASRWNLLFSLSFLFSLTFLSWFQALQLPTQSEPWNSARFNHPLLLDPVAQPSLQQSFPPKEANVTAKEQEIVHPRIAGPLWRGDL